MRRLNNSVVRILSWASIITTLFAVSQPTWASDPGTPDTDAAVQVSSVQGLYRLHIGSFLDADDAREEMSRLKADGVETYLDVVVDGKHAWYRIYMGNFKDYLEADTAGSNLLRAKIIPAYYIEKKVAAEKLDLSDADKWRRDDGDNERTSKTFFTSIGRAITLGVFENSERDETQNRDVSPHQLLPNIQDRSHGNLERFSLGIQTGWYIVPDIEEFEIIKIDEDGGGTWRLDGKNIISISAPMSVRLNEKIKLEARPEISIVDDISALFLSIGPKVGIRPSYTEGFKPYVNAGIVYGVFRWDDAPGDFDNGFGWEMGGGVSYGRSTFNYGAGFQYRDIRFAYNRPDDGQYFLRDEEIDFSGYSFSVFFEYPF